VELTLSGDEQTGRAILRSFINAAAGFQPGLRRCRIE
jgi:hypothetical protein